MPYIDDRTCWDEPEPDEGGKLFDRIHIEDAYKRLKGIYSAARLREENTGKREPFVGALACALVELDAALKHLDA